MIGRLANTVAILAMTSGVASGSPRESVTFTNVNSIGYQGNPLNVTRTATFTGADGGGSYSATYLSVAGALGSGFGATYSREACILVTPPNGTPFVVQPHNTAQFTTLVIPAGRYAIPVGAFSTAGQWTFEFFELLDDVTADPGLDAVWQTITFTLQDGAPPVGPSGPNLAQRQATTWSDVNSDGVSGTPGATRSVVFNSSDPVSTFVLSGVATARRGLAAPSLDCPLERMIVQVVPPTGPVINAAIFPRTSYSTDAGSFRVTFPTPINPAGTWTLNFSQTVDEPGGVDCVWNSVTLAVGNPVAPISAPIVIPGNGSFGSTPVVFDSGGQTRWFSFTLASPVNGFVGDYLDIDTEWSAITDTAIALYSPSGVLLASDLDDGTNLLSQISIGIGTRPSPGNGVAYSGRDGSFLDVGTYFVAVAAGNAGVTFQPTAWDVSNTNPNTGAATLNIRRGATIPTTVPPAAVDLGAIVGPNATRVAVNTNAQQVRWYKFTLISHVSNSAGTWLDIDTEGTIDISDTELGLYGRSGVLVAMDDDDGPGSLTQLSFGQAAPARVYPNTPGGNGRDGTLIPADTYYLAAGVFPMSFGADFGATANAIAPIIGDLHINFYTNLSAAPTACNAADVAGLGGSIGPDHALTADDVVVYLAAFFSNNLAVADIAILGGTAGHDGVLTADDIVYYLSAFFAGCI